MRSLTTAQQQLKITDFEDKSLLIVDDDDPLRGRLARAMEKKGFVVKEAKSVEEGLKIVKNKPPLFAIVDLRLEDGNGLDVINLKKGKISVRKSSRKTGLNKTSVKEGLVSFYEGNEQQAELVLKVILDNLPVKESTSLALTGIKEKKQE